MKDILVKLKIIYNHIVLTKHAHELKYWKERFTKEGGHLENHFYGKLMLGVADEPNDDFLKEKVVGDFGCGPRGSLIWAKQANLRIGIDVLANQYIECFPKEYLTHGMIYVTCTEQSIPIPDATFDVIYTVNALDHVANLTVMCNELRRILKPGGLIIGSYNLNHKATRAEPQRITEDSLKMMLFRDYKILKWKVSAPGDYSSRETQYAPLWNNQLIDPQGGEAYLWATVQKV
jgi:2-polyprenyl-3-methyl-5-hydroxy-6-metoxy-1,4-benzoquinol methylase